MQNIIEEVENIDSNRANPLSTIQKEGIIKRKQESIDDDKYVQLWSNFYNKESDPVEAAKKREKFVKDNKSIYIEDKDSIKRTIDNVIGNSFSEQEIKLPRDRFIELLYRTAVHESQGFTKDRQKGYEKVIVDNKEVTKEVDKGPARSYFMLEPDSVYDTIHNGGVVGSKVAGNLDMSLKELKSLTPKQIEKKLMSDGKFSILMAAAQYTRYFKNR